MAGPPGSSTPSLGGGSVGLVGLVGSQADMASSLLQRGQALMVLGVGVPAALVRAVREGACPGGSGVPRWGRDHAGGPPVGQGRVLGEAGLPFPSFFVSGHFLIA